MKKLALFLCLFSFFLLTKDAGAANDYAIESFGSQIVIEKNTTLTITETVDVYFDTPKHGIFRIIPITYSARGKTIKAYFNLVSVTDESGTPHKYTTSRVGQSINIKIGDPDKTIAGAHTYVIKYSVGKVLLRYPTQEELYWNVTGSEWDTVIEKASAEVFTPHAKIMKVECFAGFLSSSEQNCESSFGDNQANFYSNTTLGSGRDFTIVMALNKNSELIFPGFLEKALGSIVDNWGYPVSLFPLALIFFFWLKKGRDKRFLTENIYYKPQDKITKTVSPFERKHLPFSYHPIQGITPAQVGTIIDEKVDIHDVVSEIVELARLGFIKIEKTTTKGFIREKKDYIFTKLEKDEKELKNFQSYLLEKFFNKASGKTVMLSELKNHFYKNLGEFKKKLYENLSSEKIFAGNPEKVRLKWFLAFIVLFVIAEILTVYFAISTSNFGPVIASSLTFLPGILFARSMPRRTAWGYSLFRQIGGLRWYLKKGKWRHEIGEKNLFIEEILPLAVSLEVVKELARDMKDLELEPPRYFVGTSLQTFSTDINGFSTSTANNLMSAPGGKWSGSSSWSGGSGFSGGGGSSGGGFGGGGGGSW